MISVPRLILCCNDLNQSQLCLSEMGNVTLQLITDHCESLATLVYDGPDLLLNAPFFFLIQSCYLLFMVIKDI